MTFAAVANMPFGSSVAFRGGGADSDEDVSVRPRRPAVILGEARSKSCEFGPSTSWELTQPASSPAVPVIKPAVTSFMSVVRRLASSEDRRFQDGEFDLNLSYITPRIIAMPTPRSGGSSSIGQVFKDSSKEVTAFLEARYPGAYRVYRADSEHPTAPGNPVEARPITDVSRSWDGSFESLRGERDAVRGSGSKRAPPPLETIGSFCQEAAEWLRNPRNVAVVQCEDGRSASCMMICCLLVSYGIFSSPEKALAHFKRRRLRRPVELLPPSWLRYMQYFFVLARERQLAVLPSCLCASPTVRPKGFSMVRLREVRICGLPKTNMDDISVVVWHRSISAQPPMLLTPTAQAGAPSLARLERRRTWSASESSRLGSRTDICSVLPVDCQLDSRDGGCLRSLRVVGAPVHLSGDIELEVVRGNFYSRRLLFSAFLNMGFVDPDEGIYLPGDELDMPRHSRSAFIGLDITFDHW